MVTIVLLGTAEKAVRTARREAVVPSIVGVSGQTEMAQRSSELISVPSP